MAIFDRRQRALDLEEEAKAGARAAPRADQPAWKDVRREAASVRRGIPETTRVLQNEPESTGTGQSPNPLRQAPVQTASRLGENTTPVTQLGSPDQYRAQAAEETVSTHPAPTSIEQRRNWQERVADDRTAAAAGDKEAQARLEDYDSWREIYDRMNPRDQERNLRLQDEREFRQNQMDDYIRDHPDHYYVDANGDIQANIGPEEEDRILKRMMRQRDRTDRQIARQQGPYVQGRPQGPSLRERQRYTGR